MCGRVVAQPEQCAPSGGDSATGAFCGDLEGRQGVGICVRCVSLYERHCLLVYFFDSFVSIWKSSLSAKHPSTNSANVSSLSPVVGRCLCATLMYITHHSRPSYRRSSWLACAASLPPTLSPPDPTSRRLPAFTTLVHAYTTDNTHLNDFDHLLFVDGTIAIDVVHSERPFELLLRRAAASYIDRQQELFEIDVPADDECV